jgi:hypothetical protein
VPATAIQAFADMSIPSRIFVPGTHGAATFYLIWYGKKVRRADSFVIKRPLLVCSMCHQFDISQVFSFTLKESAIGFTSNALSSKPNLGDINFDCYELDT